MRFSYENWSVIERQPWTLECFSTNEFWSIPRHHSKLLCPLLFPPRKGSSGSWLKLLHFHLVSQNCPSWKSGCLISLEAIWLSYPSICPESDCPLLSTFLEPPDGAPFWEGEVLNAGSRISLWPSPAITEGAIHQSSVSLRTGLVLLGQGQSGSDQVLRPSLGLLFVPSWQFGNSDSTDWLAHAINAHSLCIHGYL